MNSRKQISVINIVISLIHQCHTPRYSEFTNFWSKSLKQTAVRSSHRAYTIIQFSPTRQPNCVGTEGLKLLPETRRPTAAKPTHHHPPPGCSHRENSLSIGLGEPNPVPKVQTKPPCSADAAARKPLQLQLKSPSHRFFIGRRPELNHVTPNHQVKP